MEVEARKTTQMDASIPSLWGYLVISPWAPLHCKISVLHNKIFVQLVLFLVLGKIKLKALVMYWARTKCLLGNTEIAGNAPILWCLIIAIFPVVMIWCLILSWWFLSQFLVWGTNGWWLSCDVISLSVSRVCVCVCRVVAAAALLVSGGGTVWSQSFSMNSSSDRRLVTNSTVPSSRPCLASVFSLDFLISLVLIVC